MYDFPNSTTVMVLAGIELIFFLEACMMLWFRFLNENSSDNTPMFSAVAEQCLHIQ